MLSFSRKEIVVLFVLFIIMLVSYFSGFDYFLSDLIGSDISIDLFVFFSYSYYLGYLFVLSIFFLFKDERALFSFIFHIVIISLIHFCFTSFLMRPRPPNASKAGPVLDDINKYGYVSSFPSGHAAIAISGFTLFKEKKYPSFIIFVAGFPIIIGRLFMNHHYLSDMIGGVILGYLITRFLFSVFVRFFDEHFLFGRIIGFVSKKIKK